MISGCLDCDIEPSLTTEGLALPSKLPIRKGRREGFGCLSNLMGVMYV